MVKLEANDQIQEFTIDHAERLLNMGNNGGWKLPEDSQFKFENHGIGIRDTKKGSDVTVKKDSDKQSNPTSAKD